MVDMALALPEVDPERMILIGTSLGGYWLVGSGRRCVWWLRTVASQLAYVSAVESAGRSRTFLIRCRRVSVTVRIGGVWR